MLYISNGVPIYPHCLGHSYQTMTWRMNVEARSIEQENSEIVANLSESKNFLVSLNPPLDEFYLRRYEARTNDEDYNPNLSFLEEKCLFYKRKAANKDGYDVRESSLERQQSLTASALVRQDNESASGQNGASLHRPYDLNPSHSSSSNSPHSLPPRSMPSSSLSNDAHLYSWPQSDRPTQSIRIHRHLADKHLLGRPAINDQGGKMRTAPLSLSANFFHRQHLLSTPVDFHLRSDAIEIPWSRNNDYPAYGRFESAASGVNSRTNSGHPYDPIDFSEQTQLNREVQSLPRTRIHIPGHPHIVRTSSSRLNPVFDHSDTLSRLIDGNFKLEVYCYESSSSPNTKSFYREGSAPREAVNAQVFEKIRTAQSRITFYRNKLNAHLTHYRDNTFDGCLLDFWDEFFPLTSGIFYHNGHTAVPRMSTLHNFLTKPCPKGIGIIQCEIERIKASNERKGANMKDQLFPSYEYRLFIRDRRNEHESGVDRSSSTLYPRNDFLLMAAKNRGRSSGMGADSSRSFSKRGVNHHYLYAPTEEDSRHHFECVNTYSSQNSVKSHHYGAHPPSARNSTRRFLGRLQSNFIGTEFQIFVPSENREQSQHDEKLRIIKSSSVEGFAPSTSMQFDFRRNPRTESKCCVRIDSEVPVEVTTSTEKRKRSWPSRLYSHRAIANSIDDSLNHLDDAVQLPTEEENGVITYTANLLGNRPRVMDVCIPRVLDEGTVSHSWKMHLASATEKGSAESMVSRFKQLQEYRERDGSSDTISSNAEFEEGEGRTPEEFGLISFQNRQPWWNAELGAFVLNFGGRVSVASVKNFQLCHQEQQDLVMLQFGRIKGRHAFTMDYQYPLTAIQAFCIALSSLQSKPSFPL